MGRSKIARIGFYMTRDVLSQGREKVNAFLSDKSNAYGIILHTLIDYFDVYTKKFDKVYLKLTSKVNNVFPNGTLDGIIGKVNRSEIDIGAQPFHMDEAFEKMVDFSYPYQLYSSTFVIPKSEYKPEIFGIVQIFSLSMWLAIISFLMAISIVYYVIMRGKYSLDETLLHSFAVLLRQNSILRPSRMAENLLVYSWVVGAMFICLAYNSVALSFRAFPSVDQIKSVEQLAKAVERGKYHCLAPRISALYQLLLKSEQESLKIIARDIQTNNLSTDETVSLFFRADIGQNLALLLNTGVAGLVSVGKKIVSEDRFLESMGAMMIRKNFCCKKLLEKFVHRLMASGLYSKYTNDQLFLTRLPTLLEYGVEDTSKRKLSLTDVAASFIFLLTRYFASFLIFIVEILSNRQMKVGFGKEKLKISCKDSV